MDEGNIQRLGGWEKQSSRPKIRGIEEVKKLSKGRAWYFRRMENEIGISNTK